MNLSLSEIHIYIYMYFIYVFYTYIKYIYKSLYKSIPYRYLIISTGFLLSPVVILTPSVVSAGSEM